MFSFHTAIRNPGGRHPVFTRKPLQLAALQTHQPPTRVADDSAALFHSLVSFLHIISGLLNWRSNGDERPFIRLSRAGSGPEMKPLDIYSSTAVEPFCLVWLYHFLHRGPDGLGADILRQGRYPFLGALYLFEGAIVPSVGKNCIV